MNFAIYSTIDSTVNRTMYRKMGEELEKNILKVLSSAKAPISTQDIALKLEKPWHSIQTRCLTLQIKGAVNGFRIGRINLWQIKH